MTITIHKSDVEKAWADRDSTRNAFGREGLDVFLGNVTIHFDDEDDAEKIGRVIVERLGWDLVPWKPEIVQHKQQ